MKQHRTIFAMDTSTKTGRPRRLLSKPGTAWYNSKKRHGKEMLRWACLILSCRSVWTGSMTRTALSGPSSCCCSWPFGRLHGHPVPGAELGGRRVPGRPHPDLSGLSDPRAHRQAQALPARLELVLWQAPQETLNADKNGPVLQLVRFYLRLYKGRLTVCSAPGGLCRRAVRRPAAAAPG